MIREFNNLILKQAEKLKYRVAEVAPSDETGLFNTPGLVVWNGASEATIWGCPETNWAFRAIHDSLHLETGLGFSPLEEVELGRIQAAKYATTSEFLSDLVYIEVAGQALEYLKTDCFVIDQVAFTIRQLQKLGYNNLNGVTNE